MKRGEKFGLILAAASWAAILAAGPLTRLGIWSFRAGFRALAWGAYGGAGAAAACLYSLLAGRRFAGRAAWGLIAGLLAFAFPWSLVHHARNFPAIHDISTDVENPPVFVDVLPLRREALNPSEYGGPEVAGIQRAAYPDLGPLSLPLPPEQAFAKALAAAKAMGWQIVAAIPAQGRIEATDTTFWFGFKDDIVVRVAARGPGSLVDARSVSHVGKGDAGANARRLRKYLSLLKP